MITIDKLIQRYSKLNVQNIYVKKGQGINFERTDHYSKMKKKISCNISYKLAILYIE